MQPALDLVNEMLHSVGRTISTVDSRLKPWSVFQRAGLALFNRHKWSWRSQTGTLVAVADQEYIPLPEDFASLISVTYTGGRVEVVSRSRILECRQGLATYQGDMGWYISVDGWDRQVNPEDTPKPRADLWPTPDTDGTPTLTLEYNRTFRLIRTASDPNAIPNIPDGWEWALVLKGRSMMKVLHDDYAGAATDEALYEKECERLIAEDTPLTNFGRMRGGADEWSRDRDSAPSVSDVNWS